MGSRGPSNLNQSVTGKQFHILQEFKKKKISFIGDQIQTLSALYNIWGNFKNAGNSKRAVKSVAEKYITVKRVWGRMVV